MPAWTSSAGACAPSAAPSCRAQPYSTPLIKYRWVSRDTGPGRHGNRSRNVIVTPEGIRDADQWAGPGVTGHCYGERTVNGVTGGEDRYFVGSRHGSAKGYGCWPRGHWGIENGRHWSLGVSAREDARRIQGRNGGTNFALLRQIALSLLKRHPGKGRINRKRDAAALDAAFLEEILTSADKRW